MNIPYPLWLVPLAQMLMWVPNDLINGCPSFQCPSLSETTIPILTRGWIKVYERFSFDLNHSGWKIHIWNMQQNKYESCQYVAHHNWLYGLRIKWKWDWDGTACSHDGITAFMVKIAKVELLPIFTYLLNCSTTIKTFPKLWKDAIVTLLFKSGSADDEEIIGQYLCYLQSVNWKFIGAWDVVYPYILR